MRWLNRFPNPSLRSDCQSKDKMKTLLLSPACTHTCRQMTDGTKTWKTDIKVTNRWRHAHIHTGMVKKKKVRWGSTDLRSLLLSGITSYCRWQAAQRGTEEACSAKQSKDSALSLCTQKDELKESHTAASMKKREKEKGEKNGVGEDPKSTGHDQWPHCWHVCCLSCRVLQLHGGIPTFPFCLWGSWEKTGRELKLLCCLWGDAGRQQRKERGRSRSVRKKEENPIINPTVRGWLLGIHTFKAELITLENSCCVCCAH